MAVLAISPAQYPFGQWLRGLCSKARVRANEVGSKLGILLIFGQASLAQFMVRNSVAGASRCGSGRHRDARPTFCTEN